MPPRPFPPPPDGVTPVIDRDGVSHPVSLPALRGTGAVSVRDLGAFGDGHSHPLRQRYRTLRAAQADFPHAASLDDETDWAATQGAVNRLAAQGGGNVVSPAGTYLCNRAIAFPECREWGQRGVQVNWIGEGVLATVYRWPTDLGPGAFAVHCPRRHDPDGMYEGFWQDIGIEGPGRQPVLGVAPAQMDGWGWGARRRMVRCGARRFRAGLSIVGDHSRFEDVVCRENLYNVHFPRPSRHLYGDLLFEKCMFSGCALAAIAIDPAAQMGGCTMISCYVGGGPYAILKESGPGDDVMLGYCLFLNCMFEYVGNAWLQDDNSPRRAVVRGTAFDTCYFQWNDPNRLTAGGRRRRAMWDIFKAENLRWLQPKEPFALIPGDDALLCVEAAHGCEILGGIDTMIHNVRQAGRPLMHPDAARLYGYRSWRLEQPGEWSARFMQVAPHALAGVRQHDLLELAPGGRVVRGGASDAPVAGACLMDAEPGALTIVAVSGPSVKIRCPGTVADGLLAKGDDGAAVAARAGGPGAIGWSNGARDGLAYVALRGLG